VVTATAADKVYEKKIMPGSTEEERVSACDKQCFENEHCVEFFMVNQACRMYSAGCTHTGAIMGQSCYVPTPNVKPSKAGLECTHLPKHNANKDERDACTAH
jgi:hypothetical protein